MRYWEIFEAILPAKNVEGDNVFPLDAALRAPLNGKIVYHQTNSLVKIQQSGGLVPRADRTGTKEFGLDAIKLGKDFRAPVGIFVSSRSADWFGRYDISFMIQPDDEIVRAYSPTGHLLVTNKVVLDRLSVSEFVKGQWIPKT